MKILKNIVCIILAFILVLVLILYMSYNILVSKLLNKDYILSKLDETEFYLQISREIESGFEKYIYQSGLPEETIKELFTEEMIKSDVNSIINCIYEGTELSLSNQELRDKLDKRIEEYLTSQGVKLNSQGRENIEKFENLIVDEYKNNINISESVYTNAYSIIEELNTITEKLGNIPLIVVIVIVGLILLLNIKNLLLGINYLSISFLSVGILIKIAINVINTNINIDNLLILTVSLSNLIISIIKEILYKFEEYSTLFIVCSCVGILMYSILKNIKTRKSKH